MLAAVLDLPVDHAAVGLIEDGVLVSGHDQERHEVLEHRAAPGQERRLAHRRGEQSAQAEPVLLGQLALRDRDEAGQARLRREQVVVAGVETMVADVVADGQEVAAAIVEEVVVEVGSLAAPPGEIAQLGQSRRRARRGEPDRVAQLGQPGDVGLADGRQRAIEIGHQHPLQRRGLRQRRPAVEPRDRRSQLAELDGGGGKLRPGRHLQELVEGVLALRLERARPPGELGIGLRERGAQAVLLAGDDPLEQAARAGDGRGRGRELPPEAHHLGDHVGRRVRGLGHDVERVAEAGEDLGAKHRMAGQLLEARGEGHEVPGQVAAVDGGHVHRRERFQRACVVPVEAVAAEAL